MNELVLTLAAAVSSGGLGYIAGLRAGGRRAMENNRFLQARNLTQRQTIARLTANVAEMQDEILRRGAQLDYANGELAKVHSQRVAAAKKATAASAAKRAKARSVAVSQTISSLSQTRLRDRDTVVAEVRSRRAASKQSGAGAAAKQG